MSADHRLHRVLGAVLLVMAWLFGGCASVSRVGPQQGSEGHDLIAGGEKECFSAGRRSATKDLGESVDAGTISEALQVKLSGRQYVIAAATGLLPLLHERESVVRDRQGRGAVEDVRLLRLESQINRRIMLAMTDAASASGKIRCERSRASELADSIERNRDRRKDRKTVSAILTGAATNVLTGIFTIVDLSLTRGATGIAGGIAQSLFRGFAVEEEVQVEFHHPHNYLKDLWEGPQRSDLFPNSVWRFLTYEQEGGTSLRHEIKAQWRFGRQLTGTDPVPEDKKDRYEVLFGEGGTYNIAQLRARAAMLELLATNIELMQDELDLLLRDVLIGE